MDAGFVHTAGFGVSRADGHMKTTADLLVVKDALGEMCNAVIGADGELAQVARTLVAVELS